MKIAVRLALLASPVLLAACQGEAPVPAPSQTAEAPGPQIKQGLTASDGKLVLPAVKGRPGAAYFMISNSDTKGVQLTGVTIVGAGKAEMHETKGGQMMRLSSVDLGAGQMLMFERGGKHVMAFDLDPKIVAGGTAEMTLGFADGGKITVPLAVETAGGDGAKKHGGVH